MRDQWKAKDNVYEERWTREDEPTTLAQEKERGKKKWNINVNVEQACARCQDQTGALHMFCDANESESCLVKAPASESVLVVGELLCTGVQANTERHTRKETREMCSCWGYKQHSPSRKSGEWRDSNFQQSSRLANLGS